MPGRNREGGEDRFVVCESGDQIGAAGAGHRRGNLGRQATCEPDVEGSDAAISGGVGGAEVVGLGSVGDMSPAPSQNR